MNAKFSARVTQSTRMFGLKRLVLASVLGLLTIDGLQAETADPVVASIQGQKIKLSELVSTNSLEIYEAEVKLYQLKMQQLRSFLLEKLIRLDPKSNGLSTDEYLSRYVVTTQTISDEKVSAFIASRSIPKDKINANLLEQARQYLLSQEMAREIDRWLAIQKVNHQVDIYLTEPEEPRFFVNIDKAPFRGGENAPVTIVEYSDFQCPYCVRVNETLYQLSEIYGDRVKIVYKQFPLISIHADAQKAAEASLCANDQGSTNFWKLHDELFANQRNLKEGMIKDLAKKIGLDTTAFNDCLSSGKYLLQVDQDLREGVALGVNSTPAFFINGRSIKGALPLEEFRRIVDEELKSNQ